MHLFFSTATSQIVSMPISIASLSWSSTKAYFLQRLFSFGDPDPPLSLTLRVLPIYLLGIIPAFVLSWALLAAYFRGMVFGAIFLTFLANFLVIVYILQRQDSENNYRRSSTEEREWKMDKNKMLFLSAMTSVTSPCMPISNKLKTLLFGAISSVFCILVWLLLIPLCSEHILASPPPITHCIETNQTASTGVCVSLSSNTTTCGLGLIRWCKDENCRQQSVRYCEESESPFDMMNNWILSFLALYLFSSLL